MLYFIRESMQFEFDNIIGIFDNEEDLMAAFRKLVVEHHTKHAPNYTTLTITQAEVTNKVGGRHETELASMDDYTFLCAKHIEGFKIEFNTLEELRAIDKHAREVYEGYLKDEEEA